MHVLWSILFHEFEVALGANGFQAYLGWLSIWQGRRAASSAPGCGAIPRRRLTLRSATGIIGARFMPLHGSMQLGR